jgi:hypothetical protein
METANLKRPHVDQISTPQQVSGLSWWGGGRVGDYDTFHIWTASMLT